MRVRAAIEPLEVRRLLSLPSSVFAQADDQYQLTIGASVPTTPLTSVQWGVTVPSPGTVVPDHFVLTLPSGPHSPVLFQMAITGQSQSLFRVEALESASGRVRTRWDMTSGARLTSYSQFTSGSTLYDSVSIQFSKMVETYFVPTPDGGADTATSFSWNFDPSSTGNSVPALATTFYMSTGADPGSTIEFTKGQLPLSSYSFTIDHPVGSPPSTTGFTFGAVGSVDCVPLLGKLLNGTILSEAVYLQRDVVGRPLVRTRFTGLFADQYSLFDTTADALPRTETFNYGPATAQTISYSYGPITGAMNAPVSNGWDFSLSAAFNPVPVSAFIFPPTEGVRNTPLGSVNIQFTHAVASLSLSAFSFEGLTSSGLTLTSSNGGLTWTLGNLAPQQTSDREYAVKLFSIGSGVTSGASALLGGAGIKWTLDTSPPALTGSAFGFFSSQALLFTFNENVGQSLSPTDLTLMNLTNSTTIPSGAMAVDYEETSNIAIFSFPGLAGGLLPDGSYRATINAAGVTDSAGNALAGGDAIYNFIWSQQTSGPDTAWVALNTDGTIVQVFLNSATPTFTAAKATLGTIVLNGGGGDDLFIVDLANGSPIPPDNLRVDGNASAGGGNTFLLAGKPALAESATFGPTAIAFSSSDGLGTIETANLEHPQFDGKGGDDNVNVIGGPPVAFPATQHLNNLALDSSTSASITPGGGTKPLVVRNLSLAAGANLDLADHELIVNYSGGSPIGSWTGSAYTGITGSIRSARTAGGAGISTSAGSGNFTVLGVAEASKARGITGGQTVLFAGETVDATTVLVKYTYGGDSNLDGKLNVDDYGRIDFNVPLGTNGWYNGDFNYDGKINVDDYGIIDFNVGIQGPAIGNGSAADATGAATMTMASSPSAELSALASPTSSSSAAVAVNPPAVSWTAMDWGSARRDEQSWTDLL